MSNTAPFSLSKARHLCLNRDIEALFHAGNPSAVVYPIRIVWRWADGRKGTPYKVLVSVSKRRLHHAVDRNRAKRHMREAFRLNQQLLPERPDQTLHIALIWLSDKPMPSHRVVRALQRLLPSISSL